MNWYKKSNSWLDQQQGLDNFVANQQQVKAKIADLVASASSGDISNVMRIWEEVQTGDDNIKKLANMQKYKAVNEAAKNGHAPVIEYLITKDSDWDAREYTSAMIEAINAGHLNIITLLKEKNNVEITSRMMRLAEQGGNPQIIEYLRNFYTQPRRAL